MPAAGTPWLLEICPTGLHGAIVPQHAHHHMAGHDMAAHGMAALNPAAHGVGTAGSGTHADFEDCPFGSAPAAGPISQFAAATAAAQLVSEAIPALEPLPHGARIPRAHRARGPPIPA